MNSVYPEHEKLKAVASQSQTVGAFLDWLREEKGISLAVQHEHTESCYEKGERWHICGSREGEYTPSSATTRRLLAEFFEIDENKIEEEKRTMLEELQNTIAAVGTR